MLKAAPARLRASMRSDEAFRANVSDCLAQITTHAATLRVGQSVEDLHQLRVALRRLDVALQSFGREFRQQWLIDLRGRAKTLSDRLAPARDLDVFVGRLMEQAPKLEGDNGAFVQLRVRAEDAREAAWQSVANCVAGVDFELFVDDIGSLANSQLPLAHQARLGRTAEHILDRQFRKVKKRGRAAASRNQIDLHRLRIALKKLRYSVELFAPIYSARSIKPYLKKLRSLQNDLGDLNDIINIRATASALLGAERKSRKEEKDIQIGFAAGTIVGWYEAQTRFAIRNTLRHYKKFRKFKPFWR
jgi:triphosphatase